MNCTFLKDLLINWIYENIINALRKKSKYLLRKVHLMKFFLLIIITALVSRTLNDEMKTYITWKTICQIFLRSGALQQLQQNLCRQQSDHWDRSGTASVIYIYSYNKIPFPETVPRRWRRRRASSPPPRNTYYYAI